MRSTAAIVGAVVAVAGTAGIGVFVTSRDAAADDPSRFGWVWDAQPDVSGDPLVTVEQLSVDERVEAVGGVFCATFDLEAELVQACAFEVFAGTIDPPITAGRLPTSPDEVALGTNAMSVTGAGVGDTVEVTSANGTTSDMRVVGAVVNPMFGVTERPGDGAVVAASGLERLAGKSVFDLPYAWLVLGFPDEADGDDTTTALANDYPLDFTIYSSPRPPELLTQLDTVRPILASVAIFLAILGTIGLLHFLTLSTRLRRDEFAILRTLGFVRRQVQASVSCQAVAVVLIGLVLGVPLGIVVGRWTWLAAVDGIGMVDTPTIPLFLLGGIAAVSIIGAVIISTVPGALAARRRPAVDLREE
jgi:putative ABC transport system permease protein